MVIVEPKNEEEYRETIVNVVTRWGKKTILDAKKILASKIKRENPTLSKFDAKRKN